MDKIRNYLVNEVSEGGVTGELLVSVLVMFIIAIIAIILGSAIKKADPKKAPKGLAFVADFIVDFATKTIRNNLGNAYDFVIPYFIFLVFYVPMAFLAGLFGLASPLTFYTIPLCLAATTWIAIQVSAIKYQKLDYLKGFTSPLPTWMPIFVPINILSKFAPMLSLSIRMFGNAFAGYILMWLVYWATGKLSSAIFASCPVNFTALIITPILHAYFDVFSSGIQTLIFVTLSMLFIQSEIPAPVNIVKENKKQTINN